MSKPAKLVVVHTSQRRPLAACVAAVFALSAPPAIAATTWTVDSCNEINSGSGTTGTLRYAAANAVSGDTIDMTGLTCSTISLLTGSVTFAQDNITLNGPGLHNLLVTGISAPYSRIFLHSGTGTLAINDLSVSHGVVVVPIISAGGGCISSSGTVLLNKTSVYSCQVRTGGSFARGGGIYAKHDLTLTDSVVSGNRVVSSTGAGGGVFAYGDLNAVHSTISNNKASGNHALGGGIYAQANLSLVSSTISNNEAYGTYSNGGGIYSKGNFNLFSSTVSNNSAVGDYEYGNSQGGGIMSVGSFSSDNSSIKGNTVTSTTGDGGYAGGVMALGAQTSIYYSTIAGNHSDNAAGGMTLFNSAGTVKIINSTISGNSAKNRIGGFYSVETTVNAYNATIAFNTAGAGSASVAAGWTLSGPAGATVTFQNVLIANNTHGASPIVDSDISGTITVTGGNNLVRAPGSISLPGDTNVGKCPLLGPLRDNGGPTQTHALLSHSAGIDEGNYNAIPPPYNSFDQRGAFYQRISGAFSDIGAYEVQQDDIVFNNGFDGCP